MSDSIKNLILAFVHAAERVEHYESPSRSAKLMAEETDGCYYELLAKGGYDGKKGGPDTPLTVGDLLDLRDFLKHSGWEKLARIVPEEDLQRELRQH